MNNTQDIRKHNSGKKWVGIVFLIIGLIMLSKQLGLFVPGWVMSWPMLLIVIGLVSGSKHKFKHPSAYFLILIGGIFLLGKIFSEIDFHNFTWPVIIMGLGLYLIAGRRSKHAFGNRNWEKDKHSWDARVYDEADPRPAAEGTTEESFSDTHNKAFNTADASAEDYIDTVSVFGGIKKNVVSKNFRGGDIVTIMGGAEINFIQADIQGRAVLEVTQLFGGTKIVVPQQWKVSSEMVALFGGIEDRRPVMPSGIPAAEKLLIIRGTSIFGGIDIRSY